MARTLGTGGSSLGPWTSLAEPAFADGVVQYHWAQRANWKPDDWTLDFGVFDHSGQLLGSEGIIATSFARMRQVETGSWLGEAHRGRGIGSEMRGAVLHFAFETLGAEVALSGARRRNDASRTVSERLGYRVNGGRRSLFGRSSHARVEGMDELEVGEVDEVVGLRLDVDDWRTGEHVLNTRHRIGDIGVEGFEPCRRLFGIAEA